MTTMEGNDQRKSSWLEKIVVVVICTVLIGAAICWGALIADALVGPLGSKAKDEIRAQGEKAFRLDVPATANPYVGRHAADSVLWLEGWMRAAEARSSPERGKTR